MKILFWAIVCNLFILNQNLIAKVIYPDEARLLNRDCFQAHLYEAIRTNRERRSDYARLSDGKSRGLTRELIFAEKLGIPFMAKIFDRKAKKFQKKGLTIICDELLSPRSVPDFVEFTPPVGEVPENFKPVGARKLKRVLKQARRQGDLDKVVSVTEEVLIELMKTPSFNCLIRNDLTTILKAAHLVKKHESAASSEDAKGVRKLSLSLLDSVIGILPMVEKLDRKAFALQKQGVAIICQDFPEARPRSSYRPGSYSDF